LEDRKALFSMTEFNRERILMERYEKFNELLEKKKLER